MKTTMTGRIGTSGTSAGTPAEVSNKINHVAVLMDASASMHNHASAVVRVVDGLVKTLADESVRFDQETRVTVYTFSSRVRSADQPTRCVVFDKDALRLPSLRGRYRPDGMTALIDATMRAVDDLGQTAQMYGEHSFVVYLVTDGQENASYHTPDELRARLAGLPDNWTMAALVPDRRGVERARDLGFPGGNVAVWDATSEAGLEAMGQTLRAATSSFMQSRSSTGVKSTRSLFKPAMERVDEGALKAAGLTPADPSTYVLVPVTKDTVIKDFVEECTPHYKIGQAFYQLTGSKPPKSRRGIIVQGNKAVAVLNKRTNEVFTGPAARQLVGLPSHEVTVDPSKTDGDYLLFVQSTSINRKLYAGTKLLLMP